MSETNAATPQKKAKAAKKKKSDSTHPKYLEMAISAIGALQERNGSSRQAIHKYIIGKYNVGKDVKMVNTHLKMALKRGVSSGVLKHVKGQGASGSFRLSAEKKSSTEKGKPAPKAKPKAKTSKAKPKVAKVKKAPAKKVPAKPKSKPAAKPAVKKAKTPIKPKKKAPVKAKTPKKAAKKATASKSKKAKSPKKSKK